MAYQPHDGVRTRSSTEPAQSHPPFPTIPFSLRPGYGRHQTISVTGTANGLLYSDPGTGPHPTAKDPHTFVPPPPVPPPPPPPPPQLPQAPSSVLPKQQQPGGPPLPPKTPITTSPSVSTSPMLPPKPPPFVPPRPALVRPNPMLRSKSQHSLSTQNQHGPSASQPPPPPVPPQKPRGARSASCTVTSKTLAQQSHAAPSSSAKPDLPTNGPPDTGKTAPQTSRPVTPPIEKQLGMNEEEALELALELSAHAEREYVDALLSQDEELARALEESLLDSPPRSVHPNEELARAFEESLLDEPPPPVLPKLQPSPLIIDGDNASLPSPVKQWDAYSFSSRSSSHAPSPLPPPSPVDAQLIDDEALARRLEAEYENGRRTPTKTENTHKADPSPPEFPPLPRYADVVGKKEPGVEHFDSNAMVRPRQQVSSPTPAPADELLLSVPDQTNPPPRNSPSPARKSSPQPEALAINTSPSEEKEEASDPSSPPTQSARSLVTPNQFVEPELLYGVSFGFHSPPMENLDMRGPLPNIISLPYGKSPPLHIRAPSWRQLLKLMAKLSATQVEPALDAVAVTKGELQLRTVVQFFKLHQNASDWRTIIYLTIDHPAPSEYRSADVNVLPYSYSLSTLPALLRDGPESRISKYYTIPATARTPLPKLPISMPSMAMYLTSALEDSRRALSDSSSGLRRLAKMIDQFYPGHQPSRGTVGDDEPEVRRRGGRGLFERLMGRTTRPQAQGSLNADVYDLVTPFVPDEWG